MWCPWMQQSGANRPGVQIYELPDYGYIDRLAAIDKVGNCGR